MTYIHNDSGFIFFGDVPNHWVRMKLRNILTRNSSKNRPDLQLLSVTREKGVIIRDRSYGDDNHNYIPDDLTNYKVVKSGQLAMNKMKAWQGSYGISKHDGIVSPAYFVFDVSNCDPDFLHKALRSKIYVPLFGMASDGIRTDQWDLNINRMKEIPLYLPPVNEQSKIVRYLDHKNRLINKLIRIKKKQIELLKELKQAIINDAVTGKIDLSTGKAYPKYKDSGIEWLGMIPEGWEPHTIGRLVSFNPSKKEIDGEVRDDLLCVFIPMENLSVEGTINCSEKRPYHTVKSGVTYFKKNDVVIAKITPCFENGKSAWLDELTADFGFGTTEFIVMRVSDHIHGKFLRYILSSTSFLKTGKQFMRGAAGQKRIPDSFIKDYPIAIPTMHTQHHVLEYIDAISKCILSLINNISTKIKQIKDLQTRLISDVVTGKLDVRSIEIPDYEDELDLIEADSFDESIEELADAD